MKASFYTLGCKVNQTETREIKKQFQTYGYQSVPFTSPADYIIINTCSVTHIAERKSRNLIRRAINHNPQAKVIVCGCYAELEPDLLKKEIPEIYQLINKSEKLEIKKWGITPVKKQVKISCWEPTKIREFLKVEDGCDQFCAYCIIPLARGPVMSYPLAMVLKQAAELLAQGARELVLTGINLGRYQDQQKDLADLLAELEKLSALKRLRLSSIEPNLITAKLIKQIKTSKKICHHLHIPLQSGSNKILKLMNRPYQLKDYLQIIAKLRKAIKNIAISTDLIVGFPGETDKTFKETLTTLKKLNFSDLHVFQYSSRPGTRAYQATQRLNQEQIHKMLAKALALKTELRKKHLKKFLNKKTEILVQEQKNKSFEGLTSEYIMVKVKKGQAKLGQLIQVYPQKINTDLTVE